MTDFKTETEECEYNLAVAWFMGKYTEPQARWSAEQQGLNFDNVLEFYGQEYAKMEQASNGY